MGMILQKVLSNGYKVMSEMTLGVTTTQVFNEAGELVKTRLKTISKQYVPPKNKKVGFAQSLQVPQIAFFTVKKAVQEGDEKSYSILDRVYKNGKKLGERKLTSDTQHFKGNNAFYTKEIFVNENGKMNLNKTTRLINGKRDATEFGNFRQLVEKDRELDGKICALEDKLRELTYSENGDKMTVFKLTSTMLKGLKNNKDKGKVTTQAAEEIGKLSKSNRYKIPFEVSTVANTIKTGNTVSENAYKYAKAMLPDIMPRQARAGYEKEVQEIKQQLKVLIEEKSKNRKLINNTKITTQYFDSRGLPEGFGHLERQGLDINF